MSGCGRRGTGRFAAGEWQSARKHQHRCRPGAKFRRDYEGRQDLQKLVVLTLRRITENFASLRSLLFYLNCPNLTQYCYSYATTCNLESRSKPYFIAHFNSLIAIDATGPYQFFPM